MIFDLSLSVDCSQGGAEFFFAWKAMISHFAGTLHMRTFLGLFLETAFMLSFAGGRLELHSWTSILVFP